MNVVVLVGAIGFESYAFVKANAELQRQIDAYGWSGLREAFNKTSDVTTLTAFTEDAIALGGAAIALVGVVASRYTNNPVYDAASAAIIGLLLMGFALALAWENKRLILGESIPADVEMELRGRIDGRESVDGVDGFRTMFVGPGRLLVTADVRFDPALDTASIDESIEAMEADLRTADDRVTYVYVEPAV